MGKSQYDQKGRKKLSKTYRNKKRTGKITKKQFSGGENKKARIIIRNLPFKVTEDDIKNLYQPFGVLTEVNLLKKPDGQPVGCCFVEFRRMEDASKAIFQTNKKDFFGRPIYCAWAVSKSRFVEKLEHEAKTEDVTDDIEVVPADEPIEDEVTSKNVENTRDFHNKTPKKHKKLTSDERKELKKKKQEKRARIIIRNLSFMVEEKDVKKFFEEYGSIKNIEILKKPDGKRTGCAFVQFNHVQSAAKAVHYANLKKIHDRIIVVDFAVAKSKFKQATDAEVKEEPIEVKEEPLDEELEFSNNQSFNDSEVEELDDVKDESLSDSNSEEERDDSDEDEDEDEDDDDDEEEEEQDLNDQKKDKSKAEVKEEEPGKRQRYFSHDVNEGKTVFIKNVPFSAKNEDLKECMEQFGPIYYALICIDPLTEYSKGTAFVKFRNVEDAEKCLAAGTELRIHDQVLDPHRALDRKDLVNKKNNEDVKTKKDSRNLYLIKEGVILAGTVAAEGVSASDMAKRLKMEQWKSQILKNLNMFVSPTRLVVHNLPPNLNDSNLRKIFRKYVGDDAVILEARIMRDLKHPNAQGVGPSKQYGFISFAKHEDALKALRSINNNPNVFSAAHRPIVAFSIENRVMVNAKKRRVEKSRENNPLWKNKRKNPDEQSPTISNKKSKRNHVKSNQVNDADENLEFAGIQSKPGANIKLRTKHKIEIQAKVHAKTLKKEKKEKLAKKKTEIVKNNEKLSRREVKPKKGKEKLDQDDVKFSKLVDKYKNKLEINIPTKTKWYTV